MPLKYMNQKNHSLVTKMSNVISRSSLILLATISPKLLACVDPAPETELEKVYCQIKAKGHGANLPEYQAFRRNPTTTQTLLLKRPARKLGIKLPEIKGNRPSSLASKPVIQSQEKPAQPKKSREIKKPTQQKPSASQYLLSSCQLDGELIACGTTQYELQTNLANKHLASGALGSTNKLLLPSRNNAAFADASDHDYLSQTYVSYIEKMIDIGLADATMSFTKYVATYEDIGRNRGDFAQRFTQMYELLKTEKQNNAVKSRYNNNFPESLEQCMGLSAKLVVCDNIKQNWIYRSN